MVFHRSKKRFWKFSSLHILKTCLDSGESRGSKSKVTRNILIEGVMLLPYNSPNSPSVVQYRLLLYLTFMLPLILELIFIEVWHVINSWELTSGLYFLPVGKKSDKEYMNLLVLNETGEGKAKLQS